MAKISRKLRQEVKERANELCEYCRSNFEFSESPFDIDHIIPTSKKGKNVIENMAFSCRGCNLNKFNKTEAVDPISQNIVRLFHPRKEEWYEHFTWSEDYTLVIGLTRIGRATVEALKLNRSGLVEQRRAFYEYGVHPPD